MLLVLTWFFFGSVLILALPLQLLGLPGTWLLVCDALVLRWVAGPQWMDYRTVTVLGLMALLAELLELAAAVRGARSGPAVRGAVTASLLGAFIGGILGAPILFGLGALPGMAAGAWVAVFVLALARGLPSGEGARAAFAALTGRLKGTALKVITAVAMVAVILVTLVW